MAAEEDNVVDPDDLAEGFLEDGDDVDEDPDDLLADDSDDEIDDGALEDEVQLPAEEDEEPVTALSKKKAKTFFPRLFFLFFAFFVPDYDRLCAC